MKVLRICKTIKGFRHGLLSISRRDGRHVVTLSSAWPRAPFILACRRIEHKRVAPGSLHAIEASGIKRNDSRV